MSRTIDKYDEIVAAVNRNAANAAARRAPEKQATTFRGLPVQSRPLRVIEACLRKHHGWDDGMMGAIDDEDYDAIVAARKASNMRARAKREAEARYRAQCVPSAPLHPGMQMYTFVCPECKEKYSVELREGLTQEDFDKRGDIPCEECYETRLHDYGKKQVRLADLAGMSGAPTVWEEDSNA